MMESQVPGCRNISRWVFANEAVSWPSDAVQKVRARPEVLDRLFEPDGKDVSGLFGRHLKTYQAFMRKRDSLDEKKIEMALNRMMEGGLSVFCLGGGDYPERLSTISDPPLALFHLGSLFDFKDCIAISGRRDPAKEIYDLTSKIARELCARSHVVVSGLAEGVDTAAHSGALEHPEGRTIAVMANGLQKVYPRSNTDMAQEIVRRGCLLSERILDPEPKRCDFIRRNRIISGLSKAHIIMESSGAGGTRHQFEFAMEQERPVFVYCGPGLSKGSKDAADIMVSEGAIPFSDIPDLITRMEGMK